MIKLLLFLPSYLVFVLLINIPAIILGWVFIPPMALLHKYTTTTAISKVNGREILVWKYKFMYIWSNDEDGIVAGNELIGYPLPLRIIYWSAIRNPSNNLRFIKYLNVKIDPKKVKYVSNKDFDSIYDYDTNDKAFVSLVWAGPYSNFRWQFRIKDKMYRFWIGWKIYPEDMLGINPNNYRYHGAGFALQFKRCFIFK